MSSRAWGILIVVLAVIIIVLAWFLITTPASAPTTSTTGATTTGGAATQPSQTQTPEATSTAPLDQSVVVTSPAQNATVSHTLVVAGQAPNAWFFEAVFPIQVRDSDENIIGSGQAQAQGDWTVPGPVTFTSTITLDASYHGPATLVLLKDNPSGLPQNDDSVEIPITVQ